MSTKATPPVQTAGPQGGPGSAAGIFDGFDIDWEWPGSPANTGTIYRPQDKRDYVALLAEFHRQLSALSRQTHQRYVLTSFLPANPATIKAGFRVKKSFKYLTVGDALPRSRPSRSPTSSPTCTPTRPTRPATATASTRRSSST